MKTSKLGDVLSKEVYCGSNVPLMGPGGGAPTRRKLWESGGEDPGRRAIFRNFLKKKLF